MAFIFRNGAEPTDPTLVISGTVNTVSSPNPINSGTRSWQINSAAAISFVERNLTTAFGVTYYARAYFYITGYPTALMRMLQVANTAGGIPGSIRLATNGTLNLYDGPGNFVAGSAAATSPLALNTWHMVELGIVANSSGTGQLGMRFNGTLHIPMTSANTGTTLLDRVRAGKDTATAMGIYVDDFGMNDSTGSTDNSWVGPVGSGGTVGTIIFEDDFERTDVKGTSPQKWNNLEEATGTGHQASLSTTVSRDGAKSFRTELRAGELTSQGHSRMMLVDFLKPTGTFPANLLRAQEGDEWYQAMSFYFVEPFPGLEGSYSWNVFFEWTSFDADGNGPLKLVHGGSQGRLAIEGKGAAFNTPPGGYYWMNERATLTNGWHDFVFHIKFSQNPTIGFLELWHREPDEAAYTQQTFIGGGTKKFFSTLLDTEAYMKLGQYRATQFTQTGIMYADRIKVGTTFNSVAITQTPPALVIPSWKTPPTPVADATISGAATTIEATTNDNSKVSKIDYYKETARNYHENPSTEVDTTGWASAGTPPTAPTRVTDIKRTGAASLRITADSQFDGAAYSIPGTSPLPPGRTWTFSCWINVVSFTGGTSGRVNIKEYTSGGELIGSEFITFPLTATGWNKYSITREFSSVSGSGGTIGSGTVGAGTVGSRGAAGSGGTGTDAVVEIVTPNTGSSFDIRADNFMFTDEDVASFDGDSVNAVWLGTAHKSQSSLRQLLNTQIVAPYDWVWDTNVVENGPTNVIAKVTQTDNQTTEISRNFNVLNTSALTDRMIKIGGTFVTKPITVKVGGSFVTKPIYIIGHSSPPPPATPVTATWQSPASGATLTGTQTVAITTNADARVDNVEFLVNGASYLVKNDPPWSFSWNTTTISDGTVTLTAVVNHLDGAADTTINRSVIVDNIVAPPPPPSTSTVNRMIPVTDWGMNDTAYRNGIGRGSTTTQPFVPGSVGWVQAIRCVFDETFTLEEIWSSVKGRGTSWWHGGIDGSIYASGNGGVMNVRLVPVTAAGQPRFTDTANMLGEELNIDPATRYRAVEASYPSRFGFSFTTGDGPMLWWWKPRKNGIAPVIQAGVVYALCIWNSHPQPGVNFMANNMMTIREYIWPPTTPGIADWPTILKTGGNGRAKSPNVVDNMDPNCPGAIGGMDPRECLMYSANGGATFPWVGRLGLSQTTNGAYAGAAEPSDDGARIPCIAYSKAGAPNTVIKGDKAFGYSGTASGNATTSLAYTSPAFPRATTLTHAWAYTPRGIAVGNITVTHRRGSTTVATATASGGSLNDTSGGMEVGALSPNLNLLAGDHYIADPSGQIMTYQNDANNKPWTSIVRPQVGALPNPFYVGGTGRGITSGSVVTPPPPTNPTYQAYWGARIDGAVYGIGDAPWDNTAWNTFESHAGREVSLLHFGQPAPWNQAWQNTPFDLTIARGAVPMCSMSLDGDSLANINSGARDASWTAWANAAEAWGKPFMLRLMWEMNGTWYNYGSEAAANPTAFRTAWQRIHGLITAAGATNVTFFWCPNTIFPGSTSLSSLYPGDAYVDWTGFDAYNWGTNTAKGAPDVWKTWTTVAQATYNSILQIAPSKPMALGEVGCTEIGGNKAAWITDMFTQIATNFTNIKAIAWFNWNIPDTNGTWDWQIESSTAAQTAFANSIAPTKFLDNTFGTLPSLTKVPVPGSAAGGTVIWEDDFERTTILGTKWNNIEEPTGTGHQAATTTAVARDGTKSAVFELRNGELVSGNSRMQLTDLKKADGTFLRPKEGDEYYQAISLYFVDPFPGLEGSFSWNVFWSWTSFDSRGSGPFKLAHGGANGRLAIEGVNDTDPPGGYYWMNDRATLTNAWHDFVFHIKFSQNPAVGFLELWHREPDQANYQQQTFINGTTKRFFSTLLDVEAYAKLGLYRAPSFTQTAKMYADRIKLGNTFSSVAIPF